MTKTTQTNRQAEAQTQVFTGVVAPHSGREHRWFICAMCGPSILCGTCDNNCCSGGYGVWPAGSEEKCPDCPAAYDFQDKNTAPADMVAIHRRLVARGRRWPAVG